MVYIIFVLDTVLGFYIGTNRMNIGYKKEFVKLDYTIGTRLFKSGRLHTRGAENPVSASSRKGNYSAVPIQKNLEDSQRVIDLQTMLEPKGVGV